MMILIRTESGGAVTEQFDTSMIPDDATYWTALHGRIAERALRRRSAMGWLSSSPGAWLVAASIACAGALGASVAARRAALNAADASLRAALTPADRLARAMVASQSPPALAALTMAAPSTLENRR
jgi:hypothetical protein